MRLGATLLACVAAGTISACGGGTTSSSSAAVSQPPAPSPTQAIDYTKLCADRTEMLSLVDKIAGGDTSELNVGFLVKDAGDFGTASAAALANNDSAAGAAYTQVDNLAHAIENDVALSKDTKDDIAALKSSLQSLKLQCGS